MGDPSYIVPATGKKVFEGEPVIRVLKYHHLGLAVTDMEASKAFYSKLGFAAVSNDNPSVMKNAIGMELHFLQADDAAKDNILMDTPEQKYCGHTHAAFTVPSVSAARGYLEGQGMTISGERTMQGQVKSVFVRDLDRTVLEFERNVGYETVENFQPSMIGNARPIDHVGTRVSDPLKSWMWYAKMLGLTEVRKIQALSR